MRIEKISEKQIRCTLNQKDLKDREIGISELAYGTSKAKALFHDMMEQASYELGFEAENIPLMIEAIPLLPEALILVITKVENPEELDTRFSSFTEESEWTEEDDVLLEDNYDQYEDDSEEYDDEDDEYDDAFIAFEEQTDEFNDEALWEFSSHSSTTDLIDRPQSENAAPDETDFISLPEVLGMEPRPKENKNAKVRDIVMIFSFNSLEEVTQLAGQIHHLYHGENTLYKDPVKGTYYLVLHRTQQESWEFGKVCNLLYEYGSLVKNAGSNQFYYEEHFKPIIANNAIKVLAAL